MADLFKKQIVNATSPSTRTPAISTDMFGNRLEAKKGIIEFSYTIKAGDNKRLDRNGILTMYKLRQPVKIPVRGLLGKWNRKHIGVTFSFLDQEWQIQDERNNNLSKKLVFFKFTGRRPPLRFASEEVKNDFFYPIRLVL